MKGSQEGFDGWKPPEEEKGKDKNRWFWVSVGEQGRPGCGLLQQLCRPLSPADGERQAVCVCGGLSPFPGQRVSPTGLPTSAEAESGAPGPNLAWPCPGEADSERTWGCPPWRGERWVLRPPLWGWTDEFGDCNRVRKSCCRRKARLSVPQPESGPPSLTTTSLVGCAVGPQPGMGP